ncbi:small ribosomal subunit protein bS18m isoform X2 [Zootoca vivipara]|uniref:small ribosomal subunit protein bS18m isoform X2 n=1 Tax=Zootoca vivipara TaxID=8524 RepID=UPI0015928A68|nr:small ribosomal subunit protein bS18m isoform X2 [Zootoca vivipara]
MAALAMAAKGSGRVFSLFAGVRKGAISSAAVASWRRECSSYSEQLSSNADMPVPMDNPYKEPPKKCVLCGVAVDYKNVQLLSQFISPYSGHIFGRHITGLCIKKHREVAKNIKRARQLGEHLFKIWSYLDVLQIALFLKLLYFIMLQDLCRLHLRIQHSSATLKYVVSNIRNELC